MFWYSKSGSTLDFCWTFPPIQTALFEQGAGRACDSFIFQLEMLQIWHNSVMNTGGKFKKESKLGPLETMGLVPSQPRTYVFFTHYPLENMVFIPQPSGKYGFCTLVLREIWFLMV